jgi:hypothetical protein
LIFFTYPLRNPPPPPINGVALGKETLKKILNPSI